MIFKQYGTSFQSVDLNFESKALNEIGFRRNHQESVPTEEVESGWKHVTTHELSTTAEGSVQDHTEQVLLDRLEAEIQKLLDGLGEEEVLVVENESGADYPKTRQETKNVVVEGENRLHFSYSMAPPLRVAVYRRGS